MFEVALDLRPRSASFGRWCGITLDGDDLKQLWLPPGLAHGFLVLSEVAGFDDKTTHHRIPQADCCARWDVGHLCGSGT
jgi:dTDP-4-dehydrorhamnose 3,5-epimerase